MPRQSMLKFLKEAFSLTENILTHTHDFIKYINKFIDIFKLNMYVEIY